jgi:hypothetical protein
LGLGQRAAGGEFAFGFEDFVEAQLHVCPFSHVGVVVEGHRFVLDPAAAADAPADIQVAPCKTDSIWKIEPRFDESKANDSGVLRREGAGAAVSPAKSPRMVSSNTSGWSCRWRTTKHDGTTNPVN